MEDVDGDWDYIERCASHTKVLVVTQADKGATIFVGEKKYQIRAPKVVMIDSTGAGDIFAANCSSSCKGVDLLCCFTSSCLRARISVRIVTFVMPVLD